MADDDQIVIEIEPDDDASGVKVEQARGEDGKFVAKEPADDLAAQFAELQAKSQSDQQAIDRERRRAVAAEQEAIRARQDATTARGEVIDSQYGTVESGLSAALTEVEAAKREIKSAGEAGDYDRQSEAYDRLATARARAERLNEAKSDLETRRVKAPTEADQVREQPRQQVHDDPVEAYVANRTPQTADWLRKHPEWVTDQRKNAKLTAAHYDATGEGLQPDTPQYFTHIEKFIGITKAETQPKTRRATVPAAPVNGGGGGGGSAGSSSGAEVRLSQREAAAATDGTTLVWNYDDPSPQKKFRKGDPIGLQEMARRKLAMTKQGLYDKSYTEA